MTTVVSLMQNRVSGRSPANGFDFYPLLVILVFWLTINFISSPGCVGGGTELINTT
jgi:hypothetical protein